METKNPNLSLYFRILSYSVLAFTLAFLLNNFLTVWSDWPGIKKLFSHHELFGFKKKTLDASEINYGYMQIGLLSLIHI